MSLGLGIFLSSLVLGLVFLFLGTKDRWNWTKLILWPIGICAGLAIAFGTYIYISENIRDHKASIPKPPKPHYSLSGFDLDMLKSEVKYLNGKPDKVIKDKNTWIYHGRAVNTDPSQRITFHDDKICIIRYLPILRFGRDFAVSAVDIYGPTTGVTSESIIKRYGEPYKITISEDGLKRNYRYDKYNLNFTLRKNRVIYYDVFSPVCKDIVSETFNFDD